MARRDPIAMYYVHAEYTDGRELNMFAPDIDAAISGFRRVKSAATVELRRVLMAPSAAHVRRLASEGPGWLLDEPFRVLRFRALSMLERAAYAAKAKEDT